MTETPLPTTVSSVGSWEVNWRRGSVRELHVESSNQVAGTDLARQVRILEPTDAAVVLGSGQPAQHIDELRAAARGFDVVRRRSGGGAVLVTAADVVWVDVVLPAADSLWLADVGQAAWWLGEVWASALGTVGVSETAVHRGRFERRVWSERMCFAGLGPGEVTVQGRKAVGICQRRTRSGALFQCAALVAWRPEPLIDVLDLSAEERRRARLDVAGAADGIGPARVRSLLVSFLEQLARR